MVRNLLREPLLHFLVIGLSLFLIYGVVTENHPLPPDRIVVDEDLALRLAEQFQRAWMRPPTREELQSVAEDYVMEEILYREALALGLDRNDLVIRRRLRQKLEFLNADLVDLREPTEAELQSFLDTNPASFRSPARYTVQQVFISQRGAEDETRERVKDLLARLRTDPDLGSKPGLLGDTTLLPSSLEYATRGDLAETFGQRFADAVEELQAGEWSGPHPSEYGLHLVRVTHVEPARTPSLVEVRPLVERDWAHEQRQIANARFYEALRSRYAIEIRLPEDRRDGQSWEPDAVEQK